MNKNEETREGNNLREFACELTSSWPPARGSGGLNSASCPHFMMTVGDHGDHRANSGRLDFMRRRGRSEHMDPPEAALAGSGGSVELGVASGKPCGALGGPGGAFGRVWTSPGRD